MNDIPSRYLCGFSNYGKLEVPKNRKFTYLYVPRLTRFLRAQILSKRLTKKCKKILITRFYSIWHR